MKNKLSDKQIWAMLLDLIMEIDYDAYEKHMDGITIANKDRLIEIVKEHLSI